MDLCDGTICDSLQIAARFVTNRAVSQIAALGVRKL